MALITPALSHPSVVIAAVAARDRSKAETYAKKHGIPVVHSSYTDLLSDPQIDAIYVALPNSHHHEWALRALEAGKHVLLEKPSCGNAKDAKDLFDYHASLQEKKGDKAPVILEAFHYRFHPAWTTFLSYIRPGSVNDGGRVGEIRKATVVQYLWKGYMPADDIRFSYSLAGGALMDFGTYTVSCLRGIFGTEPQEVLNAEIRGIDMVTGSKEDSAQIDTAMKATYRFPNDGVGDMEADLAHRGGFPSFLPASWTKNWPAFGWPKCVVELTPREIELTPEEAAKGGKHTVQRTATFWNHMMPVLYHRIDIVDKHILTTSKSEVAKTWEETKHVKAYKAPKELSSTGDDGKSTGEDWWSTYRFQLEEFVKKVKGQQPRVWITGDDSIKQMEMIDMTYEKAGLKARPNSGFKLQDSK
jgi:predicted dehydrogenase